jgi:hypothetical protein
MKIRKIIRHLLFALTMITGFVWLAPWRLVKPPPEVPHPQRLMDFHLGPRLDPYRNDIWDPVLQASLPIDSDMVKLPIDVGLYLVPGDPVPWDDQHLGRKVRIYNNTSETKVIPTIDYALYVIPEAMDSEGRWRALERYANGDCIYSFFSVNLEPRHYWEFIVPIHEGSLQTRMRYVLSLGNGDVAYSEEFEGYATPEHLETAWGVERMRPDPTLGRVMP